MSYGLFYKYHGNRTNAAGPVLTIRIPLPIYWRWDIHSWHESIENINSQTTDSITTTNQPQGNPMYIYLYFIWRSVHVLT